MPGRYGRPSPPGEDGGTNVFTGYAETPWVPINGEMVTVQWKDPVLAGSRRASGRRLTGG